MLRLALLGSPQITLDRNPVTDFISRKALLLLCYLALQAKYPLARETLACLFWGEFSEDRSRANLAQALHNIQKLLPGYLSVTRSTVMFNTSQALQIDATIFQQALEASQPSANQMEKTMALYRGDFLEGFYADHAPDLEDWLSCQREHYKLLYSSALEKLADTYNHQGEWRRASSVTRRILANEPWNETAQRQMMLLLARQGKYDAALAQYKTCRQILKKEMDMEPSAETVNLNERIQRAQAISQRQVISARGIFVGRQAELEHLDKLVLNPDCHLITLVGAGGVGKTRLAQELMIRHRDRFLDGICHVFLESIPQLEFMVTAIAQAANIQLSGSNSPCEQLLAQLAGQEILLLLDGFEHLMAGADLVSEILRASPATKIIVTSRVSLDLRDEWVFTLGGLSTPPADIADVASLEHYEAVACFVQNAKQRKAGFTMSGHETAVTRLCNLLEGLPLGIQLAASLLPVASCHQIVDEIERNLDVLTTAQRDLPERHRSLRAVFDHSWKLMTTEEQHIFPQLSVFRGGFTLEAAQQVAGADLHMLNSLTAKSLLYVATPGNSVSVRYEIHKVLRQYAEEILEREPEMCQQVHMAHIACFVGFVQQRESLWLNNNRQMAVDAIDSELDNIRLAWQRAIEYQHKEAIALLIPPLDRFYHARSWFQEGYNRFALASAAFQSREAADERPVLGQLFARQATFIMFLGGAQEAQILAQEAVGILRLYDATEDLAVALNALGSTQLVAGDYSSAKPILQECLATRRLLGERRKCIAPLANLGMVYMSVGDHAAAKEVLMEGLALCYEEGIHHSAAKFLNNLGSLYCTMGDFATATRYYEQALPVSEETGRFHLKAIILCNLAEVHVRQAQFAEALTCGEQAVGLLRQLGNMQSVGEGLIWIGLAHHGLGDRKTAECCICEGVEIALKIQVSHFLLSSLTGMAVLLLGDGQHKRGVDLLMEIAQHPATNENTRTFVMTLLAEQGIVLLGKADYEEKRSLSEMASTLLVEMSAQGL